MASGVDTVVYRDSNQEDIQEGDVLRFKRGWFDHYAVYVGNGKVVHQTADQGVIVQHLEEVIDGSNFYVDKNTPIEISRESRLRTVQRALSRIGRKGYSLVTSNCEHFATWCRDGVAKSTQVGGAVKTAALSVANVSMSQAGSSTSSSSSSGSSSSRSFASGSSSSGSSSSRSAASMEASKHKVVDKFCAGCASLSKAKQQ